MQKLVIFDFNFEWVGESKLTQFFVLSGVPYVSGVNSIFYVGINL